MPMEYKEWAVEVVELITENVGKFRLGDLYEYDSFECWLSDYTVEEMAGVVIEAVELNRQDLETE